MIEGIKVFGERNSGNNYIMHLLDTNLDMKYTTRAPHINKGLGWTHGTPQTYDKEVEAKTLFLFIVKNPYSWLLSFKDKPHTDIKGKYDKIDFGKFLRTPVESHKSPIEMWTYKHSIYLWFMGNVDYAHLVRYEDVLRDPKKVIDEIIDKYDLSKSKSYFKNIDNTTHPSGRITDDKFGKKEYYLKKKWRKELEDVDLINGFLNRKVMKKLGYKYE